MIGQDPGLVAGYVSGERDFFCCAPPVSNRLIQFPVSAPVLLNPDLHRRFRQVFVRFITEFGARKPIVGICLPPIGKHFRCGYGNPVKTVVTGLEPDIQLLQRDLVVRGLHHIVPVQVMGRIIFPAILQVRNFAGRTRGILIAVSGRQHLIFHSEALPAPELAHSHFIGAVFLVIGVCAAVRHVPGRDIVRMARMGVRILIYTEAAFWEIPLGMQILYGLLRAGAGNLLRVIFPGRIGFRQFPFRGSGDAVGLVRLHLLHRVGNPDVLRVPARLFVKVVFCNPVRPVAARMCSGILRDESTAAAYSSQGNSGNRRTVSHRFSGPQIHVQVEILRCGILGFRMPADIDIIVRRFHPAGQFFLEVRRDILRCGVDRAGYLRAGKARVRNDFQHRLGVNHCRQFSRGHGIQHFPGHRVRHLDLRLQFIAGQHIHQVRCFQTGNGSLERHLRGSVDRHVIDDRVLSVFGVFPVPAIRLARRMRHGKRQPSVSFRQDASIGAGTPLMENLFRGKNPDRTRFMRFLACQDRYDLVLHTDGFVRVIFLLLIQPVRIPVIVSRLPLNLQAQDLPFLVGALRVPDG